jgi:hypothetical protein
VTIALLRDYIKNWLHNSIANISRISAEEVTTGPLITSNKSIKGAKKK